MPRPHPNNIYTTEHATIDTDQVSSANKIGIFTTVSLRKNQLFIMFLSNAFV